jgi:hypothetical protein
MKSLYAVEYKDRKLYDMFLLPSIEGVVKESTLTTGDDSGYPIPLNGLDLSLIGREGETFQFPNANFRVNAGERVKIYATNLANKRKITFRGVEGLQVLNETGDEVLFQYKHGRNLEFRDLQEEVRLVRNR